MKFDAIRMVCEAIDQDETLNAREKRAAKFSLRYRPLARLRAQRMVHEELEAAGALSADGQEVAAQFDWMELIKILLPILLSLL